jgi:DHA1 family bicyclomycin/chloramphenicol resistance-like MFS transporter
MSAFFATFAIGQLFVGPLSDRYGRLWVILGGLMVFVAGSAICAAAPTLTTLVIGRVIQAVGVCASSVLARAIARDLFSGNELGRVLSFIMVAMAAAPGFSPLAGGALDHAFGWRAAFVSVAIFGLAIMPAYSFSLGETHRGERVRLDPITIASDYLALIRDRRFIVPAGSVSLIIGGLFAMFTSAPAILMDGLGFSPLALGLFFAGTVFVVFGAGIAAPNLARRAGLARISGYGLMIASAGGLLLLFLAAAGFRDFGTYLLPSSVFLFGMGLVNPLGTALALSPFGTRAGLASALLGFMQMTAAAIAIVATTLLPYPSMVSFSVVLAFLATAALSLFWLRVRES